MTLLISMQNEYNPYEIAEQKYSIQLKQKYKRLGDQIGLAYDNQFVLRLIEEKEHAIVVVDQYGKEILRKKIHQTSTPFRMISNSEAIVFEAGTKRFQILSIRDKNLKSIDQENSSPDSNDFQLEYFSQTGEICLIEKDKKNLLLVIRFYKYEKETQSLKQVFSYSTQPNEWVQNEAVHILNERGYIGWCASLKKQFRMQIFSQSKGVISLHANQFDLSRIFREAQFKVLTFCQHSKNEFYLVVNPESRNPSSIEQAYSPVLKVVTNQEGNEVDFFIFEKTPFISSTYYYSMTDCSKLGRYIILKTYNQESTQKKSPVYYYDLDTHTLALERDWVCSSTSKMSGSPILTNTFLDCEFSSTNCEQLNITVKEVKRNKSLAFERLLIVFEQLQQINKQKILLLIFGAEKSGKTTTRHFISGHKLIHQYNEDLDFNDLKPEIDQNKQFEHHLEKSRLVWLSETEKSVIVEIPEWYDQPEFFKTLNSMLLRKIYQLFQQIHIVITIPQELIEDSYRTIQIFTEVFDILKGNKDEIADCMSIVLTKIQDESSKEIFIERNEQIAQQNQDISKYLQRIIDSDRIYNFENKVVYIEEGKELQDKILSSQHFMIPKEIKQEEITQFWENNQEVKMIIQSECLEEIQYFNHTLLYFSYLISGLPERFDVNYLNSKISYSSKRYSHPDGSTRDEKLAYAYFSTLVRFKAAANNQNSSEFISQLFTLFNKVEDQLIRVSLINEANLLIEALSAFVSVTSLALKMDLNNDQQKPLEDVFSVFKDEEKGIFGIFFSQFIKRLEEMYKEIRNSKESKQIRSAMTPTTIIKRQVPMTYDEERQYYLKKKENRVDLINRLPCNAMKLDFMIEELKPYIGIESIPDKDIRWVNTLLKQSSKVCQYHDLFYESIVFLMIIPDFIGISLLLDDLITKCRKNNTYDGKKLKLLSIDESDVIDQLIILGREHLRESLLKKLIYIRSLDNEGGGVKALSIRKDEKLNLSSESLIDSYEKRLNNETEMVFYNFKKYSCFKRMIENKEKIITQCREFESQNPHKKHFEDLEALSWLIQTLPIPSV